MMRPLSRRTAGTLLLVVCFVGPALPACTSREQRADERADVGYTDGYAVGYNTACQIRATLIEGDFKNEDYSRAYANGQTDGISACNADRAAGRVAPGSGE